MKKIITLLKIKNYKSYIETIKGNTKALQEEYLINLYNNDVTSLTIKKLDYIEKVIK